ncbi:unnamed protein product [Brugia timori]|uniref:Uncharacterized protein n=1 Tax=Brugia timori TaxID=42155 RepID=A0A0R3QCP5_9BILA|nr:unnamed protein product [Brugia timori]
MCDCRFITIIAAQLLNRRRLFSLHLSQTFELTHLNS